MKGKKRQTNKKKRKKEDDDEAFWSNTGSIRKDTKKKRKQVRLSSSSRLQRQSLYLGLYLIFYCTYIFTHDLDYFQCNRLISPVFYRFSLFMCVRACLSLAFFRWNIRTHSTTTTTTSMHIPI